MAKQMMKERMPELKDLEELQKLKSEYQNPSSNLRLIGCKRLTVTDLERDVYETSRYT